MAFGPHMEVDVLQKDGTTLTVLLAPHTKDGMMAFVDHGGMQHYSVARYLASRRSVPVREDELDWYEKTRTSETSVVWGVWMGGPGQRKLIGGISLMSIEHGPTGFVQATDGIVLFDKDHWQKGIASAIQKAVMWFAFKELGVSRIKAAVIQGNVGSLKALQGAGFGIVHVERNTAYVAGKLCHQDDLECVNPLQPFWGSWWSGDRVPKRSLEAKKVTLTAISWAEEHVRLL